MKTILKKVSIFLFIAVSLANIAYAENINVPSGTIVSITVTQVHTTEELFSGQKIDAIVENDVSINGVNIFNEGNPAIINVLKVTDARMNGAPAILCLMNGEVTDNHGIHHKIEYSKKVVGSEQPHIRGCTRFGDTSISYPMDTNRGGEAKLLPYQPIEGKLENGFTYNNGKL